MSFLRLGKDNWARTSPTKDGILYICLTLFVGFAAINTGNNLLYLTFGMMLSFLIISGIVSMFNLARISISLKAPRDIYALQPVNLVFYLGNDKPLLPSYSLTIDLDGNKTFVPYLPRSKKIKTGIRYIFKKKRMECDTGCYNFNSFSFWIFQEMDKGRSGKAGSACLSQN